MGAFNVLTATAACAFCGAVQEWRIQFKYGDCWQLEYKVGDSVAWGGNDKGERVARRVRTDAIAERRCLSCGAEECHAVVYVLDNVIERAEMVKAELELGPDDYFEKID